MADDHTTPRPSSRRSSSLQDRLCNGLTLVGLVAVVFFGGRAILSDTTAEAAPQPALPGELPEVIEPVEEEVPVVELPDVPPLPAVVPDSLPADTLAALPADSLGGAQSEAPADSLAAPAGHEPADAPAHEATEGHKEGATHEADESHNAHPVRHDSISH